MANVLDTLITDSLLTHAEEAAKARGIVVLRVVVRGTKSKPVIEVILDGNRLIRVDDCETINKEIGTFLDELKGMSKEYRLDVLSPGIDEPLLYPYQFERSISRLMEITIRNSNKIIVGYLRSVEEDGVTFEIKKNSKKQPTDSNPLEQLKFADIEKAQTLVDFNRNL